MQLLQPAMIGRTLGHYLIVEQIGAGGMGVVYRAHDQDLDRDVALKVLPAGMLADEAARRRFRKEALSLAKLNHPNVATVHEFGNHDGVDFLVTEYIPGISLDSKIAGRPLDAKEVLRLGAQLAQGLAAAHEQGVVHRDLKPANVRITPDGWLKILDFGLAQLALPDASSALTVTKTGTPETTGTLPYMPPEQLRGEKTDARSDIWAAGAVLYEMCTGRRPFPETNNALLISAILNREPEPPGKLSRAVSPGLENLILKALDKDPARRYQSAREMAIDLERLTAGVSPLARPPQRKSWLRSWQGIAAAILLLAVAVLLALPGVRGRIASILSPKEVKHIAVLPFDNVGNNPGNQVLVEGLMESLTDKLSNLDAGQQSLWIVPASEVRRKKVEDPSAAFRDLGATLAVKGKVERNDQQIHLTVNLIDTKSMRQIGSVALEDRSGDFSAIQDEAVSRLARLMHLRITPEMLRETGASAAPAAYESYLKSLGYMQRYDKPGNLDLAIQALQSAVQTDPRFALGFARLGEAYRLKYQLEQNPKWIDEASAYCQKAMQLDDRLPAVYYTLGSIHRANGKHDLALQEFQHALELNPRDADAMLGLAHAYESVGRLTDAESMFKRAAALRPEFWDGYNSLGNFYDDHQRYDEAVAQYQRALQLTPDNAAVYSNLAATYIDMQKLPQAESALKKSIELSPTYPAYANLAFLYIQEQRYSEAASAAQKALQLNDQNYIVWGNLALAYRWLKQEDKARAADQRQEKLLEAQVKVRPDDALLQSALAVSYAQDKLHDKALTYLQSALALAPDNSRVLSDAGETYEDLGDRREALSYIEKSLQKGYTLDDLKRNPALQNLLSDPNFRPQAKP